MTKKTNENSIEALREQLAVLEGLEIDSPLKAELSYVKEYISEIESKIFTQKMLSDTLDKNSGALLTEADIHIIVSNLKSYQKVQDGFIKTIEALASILETSTKESLGTIKQNLLLSKIRKHFVGIEKKRVPTESLLIELEDYFSEVKDHTARDLVASLSDLLKVKKALNSKLSQVAEVTNNEREIERKIQKFITLMDFTASNGSEPFDDDHATSKNFINYSAKLTTEHLTSD